MESNHRPYEFEASLGRMDAYLDAGNDLFEEVDEIPTRDRLTYSNGFYIKHCTALFIDIRGSSGLPDKYTRPRLAKIYRSYLSEAVAVINGNPDCAEVNIVGDAVYGIFNTPTKAKIDGVFTMAAKLNSLMDALNCKMKKRGIDPIITGIGIDYGRLLMVQAGYSGSGLNEVVWMGSAVNGASNLCHHGNLTANDRAIMVSPVIHSNLNDHNKNLLSFNTVRKCYHGNFVNTIIEAWVTKKCP
jgi:class 3 adenylate cyclase